MELDWYSRASVSPVLSPSSTSKWRLNVSPVDQERHASRWLSLLNLIQERGLLRVTSPDECSSPSSNMSSPKQGTAPQCTRSLSGTPRCPSDEGSHSKPHHVCFACVLHHHDQ